MVGMSITVLTESCCATRLLSRDFAQVQQPLSQPQARELVADVAAVPAVGSSRTTFGFAAPGLVARTKALRIRPSTSSASDASSPVPSSSAAAASRV